MRLVALIARPAGVQVLQAILSKVKPVHVFAPRFLPKSEGGAMRPEAWEIETLCRNAGVPCTLRNPGDAPLSVPTCDVLIVCSWRTMLNQDQLNVARHRINIHRGDLPRFKGARPVRQAIAAGDEQTCITAHRMTMDLDAGPVMAKVFNQRKTLGMQSLIESGSESALDQAEAIEKEALMPLYAPLTRSVLEILGA